MPPRIPLIQCLRTQSAQCQHSPLTRAFSSTPSQQASTVTQRRKHRDPYAIAQARARKAANLSRQEVLQKERTATLGDPVRGVTTPFVHSLDTGLPLEPSGDSTVTRTRVSKSPDDGAPGAVAEKDEHLNFYVSKAELDRGLEHSKWLLSPSEKELQQPDTDEFASSLSSEEREARLEQEEDIASEALRRISSLSLGSSKDRLRVNKQRCIQEFGRHYTDTSLPPRAPSIKVQGYQPPKIPRVGADTGSSEVQIAILTAKIRTLADYVETRGKTDRVNKRNLRLLVHKRQKQLSYLRRKERGGPRWEHLVEKLGITDGMWRGEISLGP